DIVVWLEQSNDASREASGVDDGWILAAQTVLHAEDPLTHFSNLMRLFANADLGVKCICDIPTGRWFPRTVLDELFGADATEPSEEILWITRVVESQDDAELEERSVWVTTHGLTRCGRVELEMLGVPAELTPEAAHVVDGLAALTLESPLPPASQVMSLGPDILVSLMKCGEAVCMLEENSPGIEERRLPSVAIVSPDCNSICPYEALNAVRAGDTVVAKTSRSTRRQAALAGGSWDLFLKAAQQIGENEHAACMVQVPWTNSEEEDSPCEYLWFRVTKVEPPSIVGMLAHKPRFALSLSEGHQETLCVDDITDWIVITPVGPMGPDESEAIGEFLLQFAN
ncbi:MAG TPA: DUF2314 domain-containing protein, partial [Phycisphaerales bacterium]|nr:DUF2314 domain-containing protein [Phycisphaerales bacterium]